MYVYNVAYLERPLENVLVHIESGVFLALSRLVLLLLLVVCTQNTRQALIGTDVDGNNFFGVHQRQLVEVPADG
jgi:hypothetical protein